MGTRVKTSLFFPHGRQGLMFSNCGPDIVSLKSRGLIGINFAHKWGEPHDGFHAEMKETVKGLEEESFMEWSAKYGQSSGENDQSERGKALWFSICTLRNPRIPSDFPLELPELSGECGLDASTQFLQSTSTLVQLSPMDSREVDFNKELHGSKMVCETPDLIQLPLFVEKKKRLGDLRRPQRYSELYIGTRGVPDSPFRSSLGSFGDGNIALVRTCHSNQSSEPLSQPAFWNPSLVDSPLALFSSGHLGLLPGMTFCSNNLICSSRS